MHCSLNRSVYHGAIKKGSFKTKLEQHRRIYQKNIQTAAKRCYLQSKHARTKNECVVVKQEQQHRKPQKHNSVSVKTITEPNLNEDVNRKLKANGTKSSKKNLNDEVRLPDFIECENKIIMNNREVSLLVQNVTTVGIFTDHIHEQIIRILNLYGKGRIIVGMVAWFSSENIIDALSNASMISIIVNNEDFTKWGFGKAVTKEKYAKLPSFNVPFGEIWERKVDSPLNLLKDVYPDPVRAYGTPNSGGGNGIKSLLHDKYLVICDNDDMPRWVWFGSANFTKNSDNNLESGIFIDSKAIAGVLFQKFAHVFLKTTEIKL